ncbi:hypothetical protein [Microbacterium pumilum]|uniref:Secreted protein n=1 Tax=Microbacterium pumilum TaxID=344165 RepID=A0ABP5DF01_9MICO
MARSALLAGLGALALASIALAGCASSTSGSPSEEPTQPVAADPDLGAAWLDNGRVIGLVTVGSSTCVPQAESADVSEDGVLQVTLAAPEEDEACTADLVPRVTLVGVPEDVDPEEDLSIEVTGDNQQGQVDLAAVAGLAPGGETDFQPSAGWATAAGQFVILTWGSSTCVPVIEDVAATAPAEVTVTFQTPPDDQACTMDMAPRGQVAAVNDLEEDSDVELILTGGEFDDVKVPIYGTNS